MKVAILRFPGSNCDQDALYALREDIGVQAEYVWQDEHSLAGFDAVWVPGGFSFGDYLRCGAMASRAPIMDEVRRFAREGRPVAGICNGFQILCEAQLLPGALMANIGQKFLCQDVYLEAVNRTSIWTSGVDRVIRIPIAHGEGRYVVDSETLNRMEDRDQIAFRYVEGPGLPDSEANPNGSTASVAGVLSESGNVLGMMPHPERVAKPILGNTDGQLILKAFLAVKA